MLLGWWSTNNKKGNGVHKKLIPLVFFFFKRRLLRFLPFSSYRNGHRERSLKEKNGAICAVTGKVEKDASQKNLLLKLCVCVSVPIHVPLCAILVMAGISEIPRLDLTTGFRMWYFAHACEQGLPSSLSLVFTICPSLPC